MDTMEPNAQIDPNVDVMGVPKSGIKQRLGDFGRRIKRIDVRGQIVAHPLPAAGIAIAAGALVGILRPMPKRSVLGSLMMSTLGFVGYRALREALLAQAAIFAREFFKTPATATPATTAGTTTPAF